MTREEHAPGRAVGHLAAEVVRAASAAAEAMPRTADGPPAVGDLYVLDATAEHFPTVLVSGGKRGLDIGLSPADLLVVTRGRTAPIARRD